MVFKLMSVATGVLRASATFANLTRKYLSNGYGGNDNAVGPAAVLGLL